jgi:hypothetical protein
MVEHTWNKRYLAHDGCGLVANLLESVALHVLHGLDIWQRVGKDWAKTWLGDDADKHTLGQILKQQASAGLVGIVRHGGMLNKASEDHDVAGLDSDMRIENVREVKS